MEPFVVIPVLFVVAGVIAVAAWQLKHITVFGLIARAFDILIWAVVGLGMLVLLSGLFAYTVPFLLLFAPPAALLFVLLFARASRKARQRRASTVLGYLEQAVRLNLPLTAMLDVAARSERGRVRRRLERIAATLTEGGTLGEALERDVPEVDWRTRRTIAAAEAMGRLPTVLTGLYRRNLSGLREASSTPVMGGAYGMVMCCFVLTVLGAMNLLIFPRFIDIFDDFGTALPWVTRVTFEWSVGVTYGLIVVAVVMVGLVAGRALRTIGRSEREEPAGRRFFDRWAWRLPWLGGVVRSRAWREAFQMTAEGLRAGRGLPDALRGAATAGGNAVAQRRLTHLAAAVERGEPVGAAAGAARLGRLERGILSSASLTPDLVRAFEFLSRYHAGRFSRAVLLMRAAALPVVTLALAVVVGWIAVSLMMPLATLIESLVPAWEVM